jgi:Tol biopolymer transport system component
LRAVAAVVLAAACGPLKVAPISTPPPTRIAIVVSEVGASGARLVVLDEHGDRQAELLAPTTGVVRDSNPAISPDGTQVVFESNRGHEHELHLWLAKLEPETTPVELTEGVHPTWTPDGQWIVYSAHGDLYRIARRGGAPEQLTNAPGTEDTPSVTKSGAIVYAASSAGESHLEERAPDGTITKLTAGPADTTPAVSPDGTTIAFSRPVIHHGVADGELFLLPRGFFEALPIVELPVADEAGPVWSPDGRYLLATSAVRSSTGAMLLSSVIVIDMKQVPHVARMLEDRAGTLSRLTPAVAPVTLDVRALAANPEYLPELARIIAASIAHQKQEAP